MSQNELPPETSHAANRALPRATFTAKLNLSFRHVIQQDLQDSLGRSEIRLSLQTGYLAKARPKARIMTPGVNRILTKMRNGELPMDDFDLIQCS